MSAQGRVETAAGSLKQNGYFQPAQAFAVYAEEERYPMAEGVEARGVREGRTQRLAAPDREARHAAAD